MDNPIDFSLLMKVSWSGVAYRNIATCDPSQDLYDDLVDPEDYAAIFAADKLSQGIDRQQAHHHRWHQYGNINSSTFCFDAPFFKWSRFSDGSFGVWYGALDEETSIKETAFRRPELDKNDFANAHRPIIQCRRLFKVTLKTKAASNLLVLSLWQNSLVSDDYSFCHHLGSYAVHHGIELYLTPSARKSGGTCVPLFSPSCIENESVLRSYLLIYSDYESEPRMAPVGKI